MINFDLRDFISKHPDLYKAYRKIKYADRNTRQNIYLRIIHNAWLDQMNRLTTAEKSFIWVILAIIVLAIGIK